MEGEFEEDGDRVIVRLPQGHMVFTRSGAWLKGNTMEMKRQPGT